LKWPSPRGRQPPRAPIPRLERPPVPEKPLQNFGKEIGVGFNPIAFLPTHGEAAGMSRGPELGVLLASPGVYRLTPVGSVQVQGAVQFGKDRSAHNSVSGGRKTWPQTRCLCQRREPKSFQAASRDWVTAGQGGQRRAKTTKEQPPRGVYSARAD
jgi:hypothetical protein